MDAIAPAAGSATRMKGLPKFLLPCDSEYASLIERHLTNLSQLCETVWIPIRPEFVGLFGSLGLQSDNVVLLPMITETMSQSVCNVIRLASAQSYMLIMPDTYFLGELPYESLDSAPEFADLAIWRIREEQRGKLGQVSHADGQITAMQDKDSSCEFPHAWGAMTFSKRIREFIDLTDPHIGYAVKAGLLAGERVSARAINGEYFDCGTPTEYLSMLRVVYK